MVAMTEPVPFTATPPFVPSVRKRRWTALLAVAVVAMLLGAGIASTVILGFGVGQPSFKYAVSVFLNHDITDEQKTAVGSSLSRMHTVDGVHFENRDAAWKKFQGTFKDHPAILNSTKPDSLPESFRAETAGRVFDCAAVVAVRQLPGVEQITVVQYPSKGRPGATVGC
jgi:cell division transport system permease protein